jgi:hypothetical protein
MTSAIKTAGHPIASSAAKQRRPAQYRASGFGLLANRIHIDTNA